MSFSAGCIIRAKVVARCLKARLAPISVNCRCNDCIAARLSSMAWFTVNPGRTLTSMRPAVQIGKEQTEIILTTGKYQCPAAVTAMLGSESKIFSTSAEVGRNSLQRRTARHDQFDGEPALGRYPAPVRQE